MNILFILLQKTTEVPVIPVSYFKIFLKGEYISYTLMGFSICLLILIIERFWTFIKLVFFKENPKNLFDRIKQLLMTRGMESALEALRKSKSSYSTFLKESLEIVKHLNLKDPKDMKERIDEVAQKEINLLERKLGYIALIAGAAPMIGFLGTVVGMIQAFAQLAEQDGAVSSQALATGIYQAMGTTMGGLIVGISAYIAYNFFLTKTHKVAGRMDVLVHEFISMMQRKG